MQYSLTYYWFESSFFEAVTRGIQVLLIRVGLAVLDQATILEVFTYQRDKFQALFSLRYVPLIAKGATYNDKETPI